MGTDQVDAQRIDRCLSALAHRGPDDGGVKTWQLTTGRFVTLINRRLRIVDLDVRSAQPLAHRGRWITYNGELYNHVELRMGLEQAGHRFGTRSDTEVMAGVLAEWGVAGLDRCEGMWALALYDAIDESLLLSRDRFGEKPCYLYRDTTGLYFASEVKALRALAGRSFEPNLDQVRRYLVNGYRALYKGNDTFHRGVSELRPGSWLRVDGDGLETRGEYWSPGWHADPDMTYEDAVAGVRQRLERTVQLRLRADVPMAFCLSGGMDSTALAAVAKRTFGYDVHGFTVVDRDPRYDESVLATVVARSLEIRHTTVPVSSTDFFDDLRTLVTAHDGPVATISYFVHWMLMRQIADAGYRVSVSGTGADELFTGYYDHHLYYLCDLRDDPGRYAEARRAWERRVRPLVRNPMLQNPERFERDPDLRAHLYQDADVFGAALARPWQEGFVERRYTRTGVLRNRMLNELLHEVVPVILHEDDLNAMSVSVENRSPFLDRELFEFAGRIPTLHLVRDGLAKAVLRDAVRDLLPSTVVDNPRKVGFNAAIGSLLHLRDPAVRAEILLDGPVFDLVRHETMTAMLDRGEFDASASKFLFNFLNVKMFLDAA